MGNDFAIDYEAKGLLLRADHGIVCRCAIIDVRGYVLLIHALDVDGYSYPLVGGIVAEGIEFRLQLAISFGFFRIIWLVLRHRFGEFWQRAAVFVDCREHWIGRQIDLE